MSNAAENEIVTTQDAPLVTNGGNGELAHAKSTPSIETILQTAVERGMEPEALEKLFSLYEREQDRQARQAFHKALNEFRNECPPLLKRSEGKIVSRTKGTSFTYGYASLSDIEATVGPTLAKHGLSYRWGDPVLLTEARMIQARCIVSHAGGHSESSLSVPVPWESNAGCSEQQKMGVAATYAQRYALVAALGLSSADPDSDGAMRPNMNGPAITEQQAMDMLCLMDEVKADKPKFLRFFGIDQIEQMPAARYKEAMAMLEKKRAMQ